MNDSEQFAKSRRAEVESMSRDISFKKKAMDFFVESTKYNYSYHFDWLGIPIIQYPQDIAAMQELVWRIKPDLIIETGVARGGSLIFYSSLLQLVGKGEVLGIDIDIREHNRKAIESHPLSKRVSMIEGSSIAGSTIEKVKKIVAGKKVVLVVLDSNHTHEHVLEELKLYSPFVSVDSYIVVFDTVVDDLPAECVKDRPWGKNNNPKTAVREFLRTHSEFMIDKSIPDKLLLTVAPDGYLRRIR
jgi:cephalosporin hydroxylase